MTLLVENDEGKQVLFQVNSTGFSFQGDGPTIFIIKSEPLKNGEPWVIKHPAGTLMTRGLAQPTTTERKP